ncbi:MAG: bifunctional riboflavin kinase/FAD synthetase [Planctomycetota bacterium]
MTARIVYGIGNVEELPHRCALAIGNFDGVHLAHKSLIEVGRRWADAIKAPLVVLTFEPHPMTIVAPSRVPEALTPLPEKLRLLELAGADCIVVAKSEPALMNLTAEEFVDQIVRQKFHPQHIVEGPTFGFGRGRTGNPQILTQLAAKFNCQVHIVDPVSVSLDGVDCIPVSSSIVRKLLTAGKVEQAATCLARPYALFGRVIRGAGRGRNLGFPTANINPVNQLVPGHGVYAGQATLKGESYRCAISIGQTPTFDGTRRQIEAHLLDFHDDIYDQDIRVEFLRFLRPQQKFASAEALMDQLRMDVQNARQEIPMKPSTA